TGIPVSIGLAPTKTLAKAANRIAKKFPQQTKGVYHIDTETKRLKALRWLPVEDVWGIGRRHARRLHLLGIQKALDFAQMPDAWVRKNMTVVGLRLKDELNGQSVLDLEAVTPRKNIATTRTFERDLHRFEDIRERLVTFAVSSAEKLRRQKAMTQTMMVFLNTNKHKDNLPQYSRSTVIKLPFATNSSIEIAKFAVAGLQQIFKEAYAYKKAGIILMDFVPEAAYQFNLFENSDPRHKALMQTMDSLNKKIGSAKLKLASQDLQRTWKMRQEKLSPKYTTRLSDIIKIKV
ncbi:MAG TPA: DUF4113 domain-containing protein, partial [Flavobacteriales bacterium]|nr:DUF4113 domain-containing protein [Flavobacteriales bacterium]